MSYKVKSTRQFEIELKHIASKYPSFKSDFKNFLREISETPAIGSPLGNNCFKIRLAITSKGKGKSGGARVIIYIIQIEKEVLLLSIYDKSEKEIISKAEILKRLQAHLNS